MPRLFAVLLPALLLFASGDAPAQQQGSLEVARLEARRAAAEAERLRREAGEAAKLRASQVAAVAAIDAAEARISAVGAEHRKLTQMVQDRRAELARKQKPAARLVGGLITMARRPPLLAIASGDSTRDFIRVRQLVRASLPTIRQRTAALANEVRDHERLAARLDSTAKALISSREALRKEQARFAALEQQASSRSNSLAAESLDLSDIAAARVEDVVTLERQIGDRRSSARIAQDLALLPPLPDRPAASQDEAPPRTIEYRLPVQGRLIDGLGDVSPVGIRSRGVLIDTEKGSGVVAPSSGRIAFAGPFRRREGVVIIDHGNGWMSLLTGVRTELPVGTRLAAGEPLGRSLGQVGIELSYRGQPASPALMAHSSDMLSNASESR